MDAINLPFVPRLFSKLFVKQCRARSSNKTPLNERTDGLLKKIEERAREVPLRSCAVPIISAFPFLFFFSFFFLPFSSPFRLSSHRDPPIPVLSALLSVPFCLRSSRRSFKSSPRVYRITARSLRRAAEILAHQRSTNVPFYQFELTRAFPPTNASPYKTIRAQTRALSTLTRLRM